MKPKSVQTLINILQSLGFEVTQLKSVVGLELRLTYKNLVGYYYDSPEWFPACYNNKILLDHKNCFDKISKCPIRVPIPVTLNQIKQLQRYMKFFSSKRGEKASDYYEFEKWIEKYK